MNSLKIKLKKCLNVKGKLNNMEQVRMAYWEMDIRKINEFTFLNEKVEEFTSRWSQNLVNLRSPRYLLEKTFEYFLRGKQQIIYSIFHSDMVMCCYSELNIWLSIFTYVAPWCRGYHYCTTSFNEV